MKLKENIHRAIDKMSADELMLMYEHIHMLRQIKSVSRRPEPGTPMETILEMTSSSMGSWSETIQQEREV
jgi:hypothetical protein